MQFDHQLGPRGLISHVIAAVAAIVLTAIIVVPSPSAEGQHIAVLAAVSTRDALDDVNAAFTKRTGIKVTAGYAASSTLIKQIAQGAEADVFVSADPEWMDYGSKRKLIRDNTRVNLLGNELVLIAPNDSKLDSVPIRAGFDLAKLVEGRSIATGEVTKVPVGMYAKEALQKLGAWQAAAPKFVMMHHDHAALTLVAVGEAQLGIVYSTDAKVSPYVKTIGTFPADSHSPIVYPVAATMTAKPESVAYIAYLCSKAAKAIFEQYGFRFLIRPTS